MVVMLMTVMGCRRSSVPSPASTAAPVGIADSAASVGVASARSGTDTDWVRTPAGLMHRSCVHQLPTGSVLQGDTVRLADGGSYVLPRCRYKGSPSPSAVLYGPYGTMPTSVSLSAQPNLVARVVSRRRERADWPRPYSQMNLEVTIGQVADAEAAVVLGDSIKVYRRSRTGQLTAVTNDSIADGDEIEVWHDGGPEPRASGLAGRPVYFALQVVVRGSP